MKHAYSTIQKTSMRVCNSLGVRKGLWSEEEDRLLRRCIENYGEGKWHQVPLRAGLNRCRKSCRLRWLNYLKPNIKRGNFADDEVDLMLRLHRLLGNRWSLIAGRLPGRTANDVKNYWNTNMEKKTTYPREARFKTQKNKVTEVIKIIKPQPRAFSKVFPWLKTNTNTTIVLTMDNVTHKPPPQGVTVPTEVFTIIKSPPQIAPPPLSPPPEDRNIDKDVQDQVPWWDDIIVDMEMYNSSIWQSFDELLLGNSITTPRIEPAEDNTFLDIQTRVCVDSGIDDNLDIWGLLGYD